MENKIQKMIKTKIKINSCFDCPNHKANHINTGDSFDVCVNLYCKLTERIIDDYVDCKWENYKKVLIPEWCPLDDYE